MEPHGLASWPRWPRAGVLQSGHVYPQATWALPTSATASGLWPTPDAGVFNLNDSPETWEARRQKMAAKGYNGNGGQPRLPVAVKMEARGMWPTPMARDWKSGKTSKETMQRNSRPLPEVVHAVATGKWPTPTETDSSHSRRATARTVEWTSNPGTTLTDATIIASGEWDGKPIPRGAEIGRLNPRWVAQLQGYPPWWAEPLTPSKRRL